MCVTKKAKKKSFKKKQAVRPGTMAHISNPNYSGSREQENHNLRPPQTKIVSKMSS
jgi:hypothetical protein